MNIFFPTLLAASLSMSAVIVLLLLLNKLSENKIPATFRYYVWFIVLAGLLIPYRPDIPIPFAALQVPTTFEAADISGAVQERIYAVKSNTVAGLPSAVSTGEKSSVSHVLIIMFGIWVAGALAILAFHLWSYGKFVLAIRKWSVETSDARILSVMRSAQDDMGLHRKKITVKKSVLVSAPALIGFLNPTILLPEEEISSDELDYIFRHELTHYKRKDLWVNVLVLFVSAMHWFNPFVYLMAKAIWTDCETACDEAVVFGNGIEWRKNYGETIIGFIGMRGGKTPVLSVLSTCFFRGSKSMKKRLFAIMNTKQKSKGLASAFVAAIIMATFILGNIITVSASPVKGLPQSPQQQLPHSTQSPQQAVTASMPSLISEGEAKSTALAFTGFTESEVDQIIVKLKKANRTSAYYDVKFYHGLIEYEIEVRATDGAILELEVDYADVVERPAGNGSRDYIGEANAKAIALSLVGVSEAEVRKMKVNLYRKNNEQAHYEVEFYYGQIEYEYEFDAFNGAVLKVEIDYKRAVAK